MRKITFGLLVIVIFGISQLNADDLLPANKTKKISAVATQKAIQEFKHNKQCQAAYNEAKSKVAEQINKVAKEGFYDIVYVRVDKGKYDALSEKNKDLLEYLLKKELVRLGYTVEPARFDNIMLHWAVTWK
jgi:Skp family chaperone for outer membrane proteins